MSTIEKESNEQEVKSHILNPHNPQSSFVSQSVFRLGSSSCGSSRLWFTAWPTTTWWRRPVPWSGSTWWPPAPAPGAGRTGASSSLMTSSSSRVWAGAAPRTSSVQSRRKIVLWRFMHLFLLSPAFNRSPNNLNTVLEMCRHKLWMYLTLSDVEICKVVDLLWKHVFLCWILFDSDLHWLIFIRRPRKTI